MRDVEQHWPWEVPTVFGLLAAFLVVFQFEGMPLLEQSIGMVFYSPFDYLDFAWRPIHAFLFGSILLLFLAVPVWELYTNRVSLFFRMLFNHERLTLLVVFLISLVAVRLPATRRWTGTPLTKRCTHGWPLKVCAPAHSLCGHRSSLSEPRSSSSTGSSTPIYRACGRTSSVARMVGSEL